MSNDLDESDLMSGTNLDSITGSGITSGIGSGIGSDNDMNLDGNSNNTTDQMKDQSGNAETGQDIETSDTTQKGVGSVESAGTDLTGVSINRQNQNTDSTPVSIQGPDYSTSFCRPRETESTMGSSVSSWILQVNRSLDIGGVSWSPNFIALASLSGCFLLVVLVFFIKEPDLIKPFMGGGLRLLWYGFIFFLIISVLVLFSHYLYWVAYFFELTIHLFNLTWNPLLNDTVSSWCCFFSDYLNWLIYYPSVIYFLICFCILLFVDIVILLPIFVFFGCMIGFLFSLFGESKENTDGVKVQVMDALKKDNTGLFQKGLGNITSVASKFGQFSKYLPKQVASLAPATAASITAPATTAASITAPVKATITTATAPATITAMASKFLGHKS